MKADVIFVIGANPTDGHPGVRLADEAPPAPGREADRRRPAPHRPGAHAAHRGGASFEAAARHQRRADQFAWRTSSSPKAWSKKTSCASAARLPSFDKWRNFVAEAQQLARSHGSGHRRARGRRARRRAPVCHRRQRRHLLRPGRHRAQPGLDHGHGHRQPRHGHRQHRPRRRGRQPAARPEQCAGLLRHGFVPARVPGLPPRVGRHGRGICSKAPGACRLQNEPGLRIPNMFEAALDGEFKGLYIEGEDIAQSDPEHPARHRGADRRWNASSCRICS